jgi:hypothetical protein
MAQAKYTEAEAVEVSLGWEEAEVRIPGVFLSPQALPTVPRAPRGNLTATLASDQEAQ